MAKYTTRLYGAPYGRDGERGEDTTNPDRAARLTRCAGQQMECFAMSDEAQTTAVREFRCDATGTYEASL